MDELSLFAFAATTSSSAQAATAAGPADAPPTPVDDEEFVAALRIFVPDSSDASADVGIEDVVGADGIEGATDLPIEGNPENGEEEIAPNDVSAVWSVAEPVLIVADRQLPSAEVPPGQSVAQADQAFANEAQSLVASTDVVLVPPPDAAPTTFNGQSIVNSPVVQPTEAGTVLTPAADNVATVSDETVATVLTPSTERMRTVLSPATTEGVVFQVDTTIRPGTPPIEGEGTTPLALPSAADNPGSAPPVSVPRPLTSQVLVAMAQNLSVIKEQSSGSLTLRLDPPELGEMEVRFRQSEQGVELRLTARAPVTLQMLLSRGDEISRVLSGLDIDLSKLEIAGEEDFRGGDESTSFEHRSSHHSDAEQQEQAAAAEQQSEGNGRKQRPGGIRPRRQDRTHSRIRA